MPLTNWTMMEDSSIEDFGVPSQLLEFIYLRKYKQQKRDFLEMARTEVLHSCYEVMKLCDVAKLKKANDNKKHLAKEAETSRQATREELGQL
ncbi:hypothetical protein CDL15_Pgr010704 [Punica granatum]|uniref:Uncharacterized protein n=1 Tax=Punica granatum TaxID=22663 RepID=A0A218XI86_PUNGR|nr:hypothetical protein CDL15_Pgr010704 [Punica granatum]